jgi:hypothetical protein
MIGRTARNSRPDAGVYGVVYGIVVVVILSTAGLVLDIASLRLDRRVDRAASDAGAAAGASELTRTTNRNPQAACTAAWTYVLQNLGVTGGSQTCTTAFKAPGQPGYDSCPVTATTMTGTVPTSGATTTIKITWPVLDSSPLMAPDVRPANASVVQPITDADGTACKRLAVEVARPRTFNFAKVIGFSGGATSDHSVALSTFDHGDSNIASPLVVLDPTACEALVANGGAQVLIAANDTVTPGVPGLIAVNSDGSQCTGGSTTIDSNASSGDGTHIWANDSTNGGGSGTILAFAPTSVAYRPAQVDSCVRSAVSGETWSAGQLCPTPDTLTSQISRFSFIDNNYNCVVAQTCSDPGNALNGVAQLRSYVAGLSVAAIQASPSTWTYIGGNACGDTPAPSYTGNVYVDCTGNGSNQFQVTGTTVFNNVAGQQNIVIFAGDTKVSGCLVFNGTSTDCSSPSLSPPKASDGPLVYTMGNLQLSSNSASLIANQTFVLLGGGCSTDGTSCGAGNSPFLDTQCGGSCNGSILWSAPLGPALSPTQTTCSPGSATVLPTDACFAKLALWNEYATPQSSPDKVTGGANLLLQGTFFTPNAQFILHGGSNTDIKSAQFVTGRLTLTGQGTLKMVPDAAKTNPPPLLFAQLIR